MLTQIIVIAASVEMIKISKFGKKFIFKSNFFLNQIKPNHENKLH